MAAKPLARLRLSFLVTNYWVRKSKSWYRTGYDLAIGEIVPSTIASLVSDLWE